MALGGGLPDEPTPLDAIFNEINTGVPYSFSEAGRRILAEDGGFVVDRGRLRRKSDGICPAECGGLSDDQDFALKRYFSFKNPARRLHK